MFDNPRSHWPEWRTALVVRKRALYKVDIVAHSETQFTEEDQIKQIGPDYIFFWSIHPKVERRNTGVTFAIQNDIVGRLPCLPQGINERFINLNLSLQASKFAINISA
ncbi:unnamed protein product [Schistocephalus solidus]|uniref:Uncharacterized protein n=1 Tax=Schistocephalus solidus TaxID=70667 RepID=A0A183TB38_SCHSO|nr:unnamed protein product [Schistocephalus solidus]